MLEKEFFEQRLAEIEKQIAVCSENHNNLQNRLAQLVSEHHALIGRKAEVIGTLAKIMQSEVSSKEKSESEEVKTNV